MFFTRIPCPRSIVYQKGDLQQARRYFPLIGWIVGGISALIFWGCQIFLPMSISVILAVIAGILATGAFHEDGFADICDSFGGGWTKEQILTIMKDSRVGAYGAIGIGLMLLIKIILLYELALFGSSLVVICLISGHAISRWVSSSYADTWEYVQDTDKSKSKPIASARLSIIPRFFMLLFGVLPLLLFMDMALFAFIAAFTAYLSKWILGPWFVKHIGGYTGDALGTAQQVSEVIFYISILAIWSW